MALYNHGHEEIKVHGQEVLARIAYEEVKTPKIVEARELDETVRGAKGFGSSDKVGAEQKERNDKEGKRSGKDARKRRGRGGGGRRRGVGDRNKG